MKRTLLTLACAGMLLFACSKETKVGRSTRQPSELVGKLTSSLAGKDSISVFANALKNLNLSPDEAAEGLTIFIPLNGDSGSPNQIGFKGDSVITVDESLLRDHVVKGMIGDAGLLNNSQCVTLSGKALRISRHADTVWVNGVQVGGRQIVMNNDITVHTIKTSLSLAGPTDLLLTTSLEVTVWDATRWNTARPKGELAQNAEVKVYATQQDFTDGIVAGKAMTDINGKALVTHLKGRDAYYIEANLNGRTNVFKSGPVPDHGYFKGYAISGIFQNAAEIEAAAVQPRAAKTINGIKQKTTVTIGFAANH